MSRWQAIYEQLKNRRVIRTGVLYLALFWGVFEVADLLAGAEMISEELVRWLLLGGVLGFPAVLVLSWFYETPWRERRWLSVLGDVGVILGMEAFPDFAKEVGLAEYWRAKGWPDACQPDGESFECSQAIYQQNISASGE